MTIKEVKTKHPEIYRLFNKYVKDPKVNQYGTEWKLSDDFSPIDSFIFSATKEGADFWEEINHLNFNVFYDKK